MPEVREVSAARAVGFIVSRTLEAAMIFAGVLAVLAVYTLRHEFNGGDPSAVTAVADGLIAFKNWTFLLGPGIMPAVNALLFATVLRRTNLVPRWIPTLGLIGAPLLVASSMATLFGLFDQVTPISMLLAMPTRRWNDWIDDVASNR